MLAALEANAVAWELALRVGGTLLGSLLAGAVFALAGLPAMRAFLRGLGQRVTYLEARVEAEHDARMNCKVECAQLYVKDGDLGEHQRRQDEHFGAVHRDISRVDGKIDTAAGVLHKRVTDLAATVRRNDGHAAGE